jgi:hypothetical protein
MDATVCMNGGHRVSAPSSALGESLRFPGQVHPKENAMRRLMLIGLGLAVMFSASLSLTGCVVVAPRPHYYGRVWVPAYYAPSGVYVSGHWRS